MLGDAVKRGRGRPQGIYGSYFLRQAMSDAAAEQEASNLPARQRAGRPVTNPVVNRLDGEDPQEPLMAVADEATAMQKMLLFHAEEQSKTESLTGTSNPATAIFQQGRRKLMSESVAATEYLAMDMRKAAAAVVEGSAVLWGNIVQHVHGLLQNGWNGVMLGMKRRYDETPLTLRVVETRKESQNQSQGTDSQTCAQPSVTTKQVAKIMQTHVDVFMLLKRGGASAEEPSHMCHFYGPLPTWLQCLPKTRALDIAASQEQFISQVPGLQTLGEKFLINQHCVCTDRYAANILAEKELSARKHHRTIHTTCNVHKLSSVEKSMGDIVSGQISGMVSVGLAMRQAGVVQELRGILKQIFADELQVKVGPPKCKDLRCLACQVYFPLPYCQAILPYWTY